MGQAAQGNGRGRARGRLGRAAGGRAGYRVARVARARREGHAGRISRNTTRGHGRGGTAGRRGGYAQRESSLRIGRAIARNEDVISRARRQTRHQKVGRHRVIGRAGRAGYLVKGTCSPGCAGKHPNLAGRIARDVDLHRSGGGSAGRRGERVEHVLRAGSRAAAGVGIAAGRGGGGGARIGARRGTGAIGRNRNGNGPAGVVVGYRQGGKRSGAGRRGSAARAAAHHVYRVGRVEGQARQRHGRGRNRLARRCRAGCHGVGVAAHCGERYLGRVGGDVAHRGRGSRARRRGKGVLRARGNGSCLGVVGGGAGGIGDCIYTQEICGAAWAAQPHRVRVAGGHAAVDVLYGVGSFGEHRLVAGRGRAGGTARNHREPLNH